MATKRTERLITWTTFDVALQQVLLIPGGLARRVVESMIAVSGGTGGVSAADKSALVAVRRRTTTDEAAPTDANWSARPAGFGLVMAVGAAPAPVDALPGDLHILPPPGAGFTATTSFALADGSAWPSPWVLERVAAGGSATVQDGMGVLTSGALGGYAGADIVAERFGEAIADSDVLLSFRLLTDEPRVSLVFRSNNASLDPAQGVVVSLTPSGVSAATVSSFTYSTVGSVTRPHTVGADYRCRVSLIGGALQVRTWKLADPEPETWDVTGTVPTGVTGYQGITIGSGAAAAAQSAAFDDIAFTIGGTGYGTAYGVAYGIS